MIKCENCGSILNSFGTAYENDEVIGCKINNNFCACDECTFVYETNECKKSQGKLITVKDFKGE